jgi:hypothetical protein
MTQFYRQTSAQRTSYIGQFAEELPTTLRFKQICRYIRIQFNLSVIQTQGYAEVSEILRSTRLGINFWTAVFEMHKNLLLV